MTEMTERIKKTSFNTLAHTDSFLVWREQATPLGTFTMGWITPHGQKGEELRRRVKKNHFRFFLTVQRLQLLPFLYITTTFCASPKL